MKDYPTKTEFKKTKKIKGCKKSVSETNSFQSDFGKLSEKEMDMEDSLSKLSDLINLEENTSNFEEEIIEKSKSKISVIFEVENISKKKTTRKRRRKNSSLDLDPNGQKEDAEIDLTFN